MQVSLDNLSKNVLGIIIDKCSVLSKFQLAQVSKKFAEIVKQKHEEWKRISYTVHVIKILDSCGKFNTEKVKKLNPEERCAFIEVHMERWYKYSNWKMTKEKLAEIEIYFACNDLSVKCKWSDEQVKAFANSWGYSVERKMIKDFSAPFSVLPN